MPELKHAIALTKDTTLLDGAMRHSELQARWSVGQERRVGGGGERDRLIRNREP